MKRIINTILSFVMVFIMLFSVSSPVFEAEAASAKDLPIVYVPGRSRTLYNSSGKKIYPFNTSVVDQIKNRSDDIIKALRDGILTQNWDKYCDTLVDIVGSVFKDITLNNDGEVKDGSYHKKNASPKVKTSNFTLTDYYFEYDPRVDPFESADELNDYINAVLDATNAKKVQLVSLCLGSSVIATYLTKYGISKVDTAIFYVPTCNGSVECGAPFSGRVKFDADAIQKYVESEMASSDEDDMFVSLVAMLYQVNVLGLGTKIAQSIYDKIADKLMPRLLLAAYATMPTYWSMVSDEYYEDAKELIFRGDTATYGKMIEKIDRYHYEVQVPLANTLKSYENRGLNIAVITEYNSALPPIFEGCEMLSDGMVEVHTQSFGAIAADHGKTLSKQYLDSVVSKGKIDYVSNDLTIDASTCLFPDNTWFVKDVYHADSAPAINRLITEILHSKTDFTIHSSKEYPQFMKYIAGSDELLPVEISDTPGSGSTDPSDQIGKASISLASVSGLKNKTYTGKSITQSLTVKHDGKTLKSGTDYSISYKNNISIGTATVTIKGKGKYTGSKILTFSITPTVPSGITAAQGTTEVTLNWKKVAGATGYRIYKYNSKTKKYESVKTIKSGSTVKYTVSKLKAGTTYKFKVKAFTNVNGETIWGSATEAFTVATKPAKVTVSSASSGTDKIALNWKKVTGAAGYRVYKYNSKTKKYETVATLSSGSTVKYTFNKLKAGTTYKFKVKAYSKVNGKTIWGSASSVYTAATKPKKVTLSKVSAGSKKATPTWKAVTGASGYQVVYSTSKNFNNPTKVTVSGKSSTKTTIKKLKKGKKYYFKVRAYKTVSGKKIYGSYSSVKSVKVK